MNEQEILELFGSWEAYDKWHDGMMSDIAEEESEIDEYFASLEADRIIDEMKSFP